MTCFAVYVDVVQRTGVHPEGQGVGDENCPSLVNINLPILDNGTVIVVSHKSLPKPKGSVYSTVFLGFFGYYALEIREINFLCLLDHQQFYLTLGD